MSIWDFADSAESVRAIADAALLSSALFSGPREWRLFPRPLPFAGEFGVFGAGIVQYRNGLSHFLLVNREQAPLREMVPLFQTRGPRQACEILFGRGLEAMSRTMAMGIETPVAHMSPGDDVSTSINGAGGTQISWGGKQGILTAGHVGAPAGATAYSAGARIGKVVLTSVCSGNAAFTLVAGHADKRELNQQPRRYYGSNLSLAYQRALEIEGAMVKLCKNANASHDPSDRIWTLAFRLGECRSQGRASEFRSGSRR